MKEVEPIVADRHYDLFGTHQVEEAPGVTLGVKGEVKNKVGHRVVFQMLITRRREKSHQKTILAFPFSYGLDNRTRLFEFAIGGSVDPNNVIYAFTGRLYAFELACPSLKELV